MVLYLVFRVQPQGKSSDNRVTIARRPHLFPSRTQQLSSLAPMILGGKLPGKVGRRPFDKEGSYEPSFFMFFALLIYDTGDDIW